MKCHGYYDCRNKPEGTGCVHDPWRRLTQADLGLPQDTPVRFNGHRTSTLGEYSNLYLAGDYPFLLGMQAFWDIEVPDERFRDSADIPGDRKLHQEQETRS